jgi:hypothetical protein
MTEDKQDPPAAQGPPTRVPTTFGVQLTLPPGGTQTIKIPVTRDTLLYGLTVRFDRPTIVRCRIEEGQTGGAPVTEAPDASFKDYLEHEFPHHLAALAGEDLNAWNAKNQALTERALSGEDEALFELLARDPRQLSTEFTLGRVLTWRTDIQTYSHFYRFKPSRFILEGGLFESRERMERARENLKRLGESQLQLYDFRGKRPLPPPAALRGTYYGLLCLFRGLKSLNETRRQAGDRPEQAARLVSALVDGLLTLGREFLFYVAIAAKLVRDPEILAAAGLSDSSPFELVAGRAMAPSEMARLFTGAAFEVSEDTVERLAALPIGIPLPPEGDEWRLLGGPLDYSLLDFPEVKELVARLTR